jgi:transposase-like protein
MTESWHSKITILPERNHRKNAENEPSLIFLTNDIICGMLYSGGNLMIRIKLTDEEKMVLERYRSQTSSENSEKALIVIMSSEGRNPVEIARSLKRHPHTVRKWLIRYQKKGVMGLKRLYYSGRSSRLRQAVRKSIQNIIRTSPLEFGY